MLPNGLLAVASESNLIRIFNYTNSNLTKTLNGHKNIVTNLELIVGNKFVYLASAGIDTTILIWDLNDNYKCIRNMTYSSDESYSHYLKFIEHSNLLVSSSSNKTVNIWEMPSGKLQKTLDDFIDFGFGIFLLGALDTTRKKKKFKSRERWSNILVNNFEYECE